MYDLNQMVFLALNHFAGENRAVDAIVIFIANATPYFFMAYLVYAWFKGYRHESLYAGYAAVIGIVFNQFVGMFYFHNRPFMDHLGHTLLTHTAENSFPSDHVTFTLSIALTLMVFSSTRKIAIAAVFLALGCGLARVYCGVHYPLDVAGAMMVSLAAVGFIGTFKSQLRELNHLMIAQWCKIMKVASYGNR